MSCLNKKALNKVIEGTPAERVYLCGKDFSLFFAYYFIDYIKYPFAPFHYDFFKDLNDLMEDNLREVAWIAFRESAKTSIAKAFVTWMVCYKKRRYINVDSFDKENSERILFDIVVELQTNNRIKQDFGDLYNAKRNLNEVTQKRVSNFITNNGVRVEAHSTQESVRGRIHGHQRPDFVLLDDFENNKTKDSKAYTEQVIRHIDEFKAGLDSTAKVLYLGNYITEYGSIQTLKERAKTDDKIKYRDVPVMIDDKPTWPDKYSLEDEPGKVSLRDKRIQLGTPVFMAEMMNQPIDESTAIFKKDWFKYKETSEVRLIGTRKFALIDTAVSKNEDSDYTGIAKVCVDKANNWYVSARRHRVNAKGIIDIIFQLHYEGCEKIGIEQTAYTDAIEPFFQDECRKRNQYPYIVPMKHGGIQKETRIQSLVPKYESGAVWHITGETDDLEEEMIRFPNGKNDDVLDALAYGMKLCEPPYANNMFEQSKPAEYQYYPDLGI
jgi:phage terminase large subunit-like protein